MILQINIVKDYVNNCIPGLRLAMNIFDLVKSQKDNDEIY
jgi:hypothetical protein